MVGMDFSLGVVTEDMEEVSGQDLQCREFKGGQFSMREGKCFLMVSVQGFDGLFEKIIRLTFQEVIQHKALQLSLTKTQCLTWLVHITNVRPYVERWCMIESLDDKPFECYVRVENIKILI